MKALLLVVWGVIASVRFSDAQFISPSVISSSGSFSQNGSVMLSSTIGEMTMVETFSSGNSILTQGFQQVYDFGVGIPVIPSLHEITVFPNPTSGNLTILLPSSSISETEVMVFDAIGKLVYKKTISAAANSGRIQLSLTDFVDGMYLFEIKTKTENCFQKITIIR